ncbi:hypothetical protein MRB53_022914 [Persea americana]|uniref:Uncharacterized protein n=1 Tax=Persea americana TaxID=3435 RepID=A0ACC2L7T3_PERAE|nr:hypothetical protein MRB53_022914 [Persea americana]
MLLEDPKVFKAKRIATVKTLAEKGLLKRKRKMESTINVAFKSRKVIVIAEAALKVKLAPEIIRIAALAPPTLLFGSVSPFDMKKDATCWGQDSYGKGHPGS